LSTRRAELEAQREAVLLELKGLEAWVGQIRESFGNPYFYSGPKHGRPKNAEKSATKYTGQSSHETARALLIPLMLRLREISDELTSIRDKLVALSAE
jgi:hypothetical protein